MYCFSWMNAVWEQLSSSWLMTVIETKVLSLPAKIVSDTSYNFQSLPDDIIYEILIKLPAKEVLDYRRVCKDWNIFTSSSKFTSKHLRSSRPSILIVYMKKRWNRKELRAILFDDWWVSSSKKRIKRLGPGSICPVPVGYDDFDLNNYFEYPGIFIFTPKHPLIAPYDETTPRRSHVLYNPVTRQMMVLNTCAGYICGCFYNSSKGEYQALWVRRRGDCLKYRILDLGSPTKECSWRPLNSFDHEPRDGKFVQSFHLSNEYLYWMSSVTHYGTQETSCGDSIIMFDMSKEVLSTIPHPGRKCKISRHRQMHLLELKDGSESLLCLCDCSYEDRLFMWVLENSVKRKWVMKYKITLDSRIYRSRHKKVEITPFGLLNGEILLNIDTLGIFLYTLSNGRLGKIIKNGNICFNIKDCKIICVSLFYNNLASFTNFRGLYVTRESC